ncbi:putative Tctex-1-like superfamily protein [Plasmopara halstedii]
MLKDTCYDFPLLQDEVSFIVQDAVRTVLEGNVYDNTKANEWVNLVTTACIADLKRLCPNFKYIVSCFIRQRKGAGLEIGSCTYWDDRSDGSCTVLWENATITTVLYVYGLAI